MPAPTSLGPAFALTLLAPMLDADPVIYVAFLAGNEVQMTIRHLLIYLVAGVCMVPMVWGVHARLQARMPVLPFNATAFGLIWTGRCLRHNTPLTRR